MASYSVLSLSERVEGRVLGDESTPITGLSSLFSAKKGDLACVFHPKQLQYIPESSASCFLVDIDLTNNFPSMKPCIQVISPVEAFASLSDLFDSNRLLKQGVDKTAVLGQQVQMDDSVYVGPHAVIGDNVSLGKNTHIGAGVIIHDNVSIGHNVWLDTGVIIGAHPFNPSKSKGIWSDGKAFGTVLIGDEVSIGANTVIDKGVHSDTLIEPGVKIDNLVQVAHDVIIGKQSIVIACAAIGANTVIGDHCTIGGGVSIAGQLTIADDVFITGTSVVSRSIRQQGIYSSGTTVTPHKQWRRNVARFHRLDLMALKLRRLEQKLKDVLEREQI